MDMPVYLTKEGILVEMKENIAYLNECNLEFWKADNPTRISVDYGIALTELLS